MTTDAAAYRPANEAAAQTPAWRVVAKAAGLTFMRIGLLLVAAILLWKIRESNGVLQQAAFGAVCLSAVYIALGSGFRAWGVYIVGFVLFAQARAYGDDLGIAVQYQYPITADEVLFFGQVPTVWLQDRLYAFERLGPLEVYTMGAYLSYFLLPHGFAFCLWKWDRPRFNRYLVAFMGTLWLGVLACFLVPTAPPWLAGQTGDMPQVYRVVTDMTQSVSPGAYDSAHSAAGVNPVAAMPSLHAAVPFLMMYAVWSYSRLRWLALGYALSMTLAIVYLGEHYVVDAIAGAALAGGCWIAAGSAIRRWNAGKDSREAPGQPDRFPDVTPAE